MIRLAGRRLFRRFAALLALAALAGLPAAARERAARAGRSPVTVAARETSRVPLQEMWMLDVPSGDAREERARESLAPLSLASADFDEDGVPDLVAGYGMGSEGVLTFWRGNEDSIHPNAPRAQRRRESGEFSDSPFLKAERSLALPAVPELVVAGDFNGDGHADVLFTARGSSSLLLLPGNGRGGFGMLRSRELPGFVTAMTAGVMDPRGATLGVAVAVVTGRGSSLLIFGPEPLLETPEALALPEPATALALGRLDDDLYPDLAVAAGSELLLVHGRAGSFGDGAEIAGAGAVGQARRVERRSLPFIVAAVATGSFGPGFRDGVALLAEGGRPYLLVPREEPAPASQNAAGLAASSRAAGQAVPPNAFFPLATAKPFAARATRVSGLGTWDLTEAGGEAGDGRVLITARLTGSAEDDLVVSDASGGRIQVVSAAASEDAATLSAAEAGKARPAFANAASIDAGGKPVAVLPMRLNADAASDLVVLRAGSIAPAVALTASTATLTVNSTGDLPDASPGNGICADSGGNCTLRAAIQEANASAGADTIHFAIAGAGVHTITLGSQLPVITGAVTIDGTTQPGYAGSPLIEVKGAIGQLGLTLQVSDCVVRGLAINGFTAAGSVGGVGIYITSIGPLVKNALIEGNFIGTDATGTLSKPNHLGIDVENTSLNMIGGTTAAARNLISGNDFVGIQVIGPGASNNTFQGNYVGTELTGASALGNPAAGFNIFANGTVIGGAAAGAGNVISGNGGGIFTSQFCSGPCFGSNTTVKANKIGTNAAGDAAVGNGVGVQISSPGSPNSTIANNLVSGNTGGGIATDETLTTVTTITGNFVGTDITGTKAIPNSTNGGILVHAGNANVVVAVGGATGTTPGGSCTGSCNLVSGNSPFGVYAYGPGPVSIVYNSIGTDVTGTVALGNDQGGVILAAAGKAVGSSSGGGNLISGNGNLLTGGFGILSQSTGSPGNIIKGNLIGTNAAGTAAVGNLGTGVRLGASDTLGGSGGTNVISGNVGFGVTLDPGAGFTSILNNFIGARSNGAPLGNGLDGIALSSSGNTIGLPALGNLIAYNGGNGVTVDGSGTHNAIRSNAIHHNTGLGIDLGGDGVTLNDPGDGDTGPNDLMNYPDGLTAVWDGTSTTIGGHVDTPNPNTVAVDIFSNSIKDPTDHGQGEAYLGSATPDTSGNFCLTITGLPIFTAGTPPPGVLPQPPWLSATATSTAGSTSEFAATTPPPVTLIALEVVQASQDWANSIPLIKNKETYVRAHMHMTDPSGSGVIVQVRLHGFQGGVELASSPITPFNFGDIVVKPPVATHREFITNSANFRLPDAWLNGTIKLSLERTDGPIACGEPAEAALPGGCADCGVQVSFEEGSAPQIRLPLVAWNSGAPDVNDFVWDDAHIDDLIRQLTAIYPVASLPNLLRGKLKFGGTITQQNDLSQVNKLLESQRLLDGCATVLGCQRRYYGVLRTAQVGGRANKVPGTVASGLLPENPFSRRNRHAHELGHTIGHDHCSDAALFGNPTDSNGNPNLALALGPCTEVAGNPPKPSVFPNFFTVNGSMSATLGPMNSGENARVMGFDTSEAVPRVMDDTQHFDLMSYCMNDPNPPRWISDFTYKNLHSEILAMFPPSIQSAKTSRTGTVQDYILVRGDVDLTTNAARIDPLLRLPSSGTPDLPAAGLYTLQMRNVSDGVVSQVAFKPTVDGPETLADISNVARFVIPVPFDASIRKALVLRDGVVLASRTASANPPVVTVTYPNGGENITQDPVLLQWTASDLDGGPLTFAVQFSADNGSTWDTLAIDSPDQSLSVPHSSLAKTTSGLVRVIASDGFHTAVDQSNAVFSVANNAPTVKLLNPTAGQSFAGNQQVIFKAYARDVEDGLLSGASLQWTSSLDGNLGSGSSLLKRADQLTPGNHTITVTATDSGALFAQASANISVAVSAPVTFADLSILETSSPTPPVVGSPLILMLAVSNAGRDAATGVTVADTLPAGSSFGSAGASQGSCGQSSGVVTCSLGSIAADATATVTITITPSSPGQKSNTATVGAGQTDPLPANNSTSVDLFVLPAAPTVSNPAGQTVCAGGTAVFSATGSGTPPLSYRWRKNGFELSDGGAVSGSGTATLTINPAAAGDSGNYEVEIVDGYGQGKFSAVAVLTVNGPPSAAISSAAAFCASRSGNRASVPSAGPGATYSWSIGNGTINSGGGTNTIVFTSGASGSVTLNVTVTGGCGSPASNGVVLPIGACAAQPQSLVVDPSVDISNGNGILEPGETAMFKPFWKNPGGSPLSLSGTATAFTGPPGAVYTRNDTSADYGSIAPGATNDCATATGNCYEISVSDPPVRPATHWDSALTETLSDGDAPTTWPIHIGQSFTDVPRTHTFYQFVERILHNGVTTGCTGTTYCPDDFVFRLQMAVFIARAQAGGDANVPSSGTAQGQPYNCVNGGTSLFTDIDPTNPFCRHVHYIYATNVTTGCSPGMYCPDPDVTRAQMALFISRAIAGSDAAVPLTYGPDPVTGRSYSCNPASPNLFFSDITTSDIFCRATHYLWAKNVISGFPDGTYGPALNVTRGAMAKFLANGFNLSLIR